MPSSPASEASTFDDLVHRPSLRTRLTAGLLAMALLALFGGVWASPQVRRWGRGPTVQEVELQSAQARAKDLKRRNDELSAQLSQPRPPETDAVQQARADDLQRKLRNAEERLRAPRPITTDDVQRARAEDLARQVDELNDLVARPRPTVDPLAGVTASLTKGQIVAGRSLLGLYTTQSPFNYGEVDLIQSQLQRKANIVGYFQSWNDAFDDRPIRSAWSRGQVPLLTWESQDQVGVITADAPEFSLPRILSGAFDDYIRSYAKGLRALRMPVILRFDHEMNGAWYPWSEVTYHGTSINGNSKGDYARTWRHVHDIFAEEGANDYVIWLWSPNRINRICNMPPPRDFYPGDSYVDWVGMSGYYRSYEAPAGDCDDLTPTFDGVFGKTLPELRAPALPTSGKPILLAEIGGTEQDGHKTAFVSDLFAGLARNSDVIGFCWFSLAVASGDDKDRRTNDWRINSSPEAITTMRTGLAQSGFGIVG